MGFVVHPSSMYMVLSILTACVHSPGGVAPQVQKERSLVELQAEVLPSVALLYGLDEAGKLHFGSGVLLEQQNMVLTNWHVVEPQSSISVVLYDPERETYTALDGGLPRMIREESGSALRGEVVSTDIINDLALVEVQANLMEWPSLEIREAPIMSGESVWAVGHPAGNLWSFTRGVVSAVHRGAVQHDASANGGNSGGPLLDMQGRLVGINTFKLLEAAGQVVDGISYARPMSIAAPLYDEEAVFPMDLSSPESSIRSFWMAVELGRVEALNAVEMQASWELFKEANLSIKRTWFKEDFPVLLEETRERYGLPDDSVQMIQEGMEVSFEAYIRELFDSKESKDEFLAEYRAAGEALILGNIKWGDEESFEENLELMFEEWGQDVSDERRAEIEAYQSSEDIVDLMKAYVEVVREMPGAFELACGLTADVENPRTLTDLLRLGMSVDAVRIVNEGENAWVLTTGLQSDGQPFGCSNYFRKSGESWLQDSLPKEADIRTLPSDFPGVRRTYETELAAYEEAVSSVLRQVETTTFWLGIEVALGEGATED